MREVKEVLQTEELAKSFFDSETQKNINNLVVHYNFRRKLKFNCRFFET